MRFRRPTTALVLILAAAGLTGCTSSPTSAASVGGIPVSEQEVQDRTTAFLAGKEVDDDYRAAINRLETTQLVRQLLLERAATEAGVTVTDAQITSTLQQNPDLAAATGAPADQGRQAARDYLLLVGVLKKQTGGVPVTEVGVRGDYVLKESRDAALAARTRYIGDLARLKTEAETQAALGSQPQTDQEFTSSSNAAAGTAGLFNSPVGSVLVVKQQSGYLVIGITARTTTQTTLSSAEVAGSSEVLSLGPQALAPTAAAAGVAVNPRIGTWDPVTVQVAAPPGGV